MALKFLGAAVEVESVEQLRVEPDRRFEFALGFVRTIGEPQRDRTGQVRLGKIGCELECFQAGDIRLNGVDGSHVEISEKNRSGDGDRRVGESVARVDLYRLLEHLYRILETLATVLVKELSPAQIIVVGVDVDGAESSHREFLALAQDHPQRLDDRLRDILLDREDVFHLAVVFLGPQVIAVGDIYELRGYA